MKIWKIHLLTDGQLERLLEEARREQRRINSTILAKTLSDNCDMATYIAIQKGRGKCR